MDLTAITRRLVDDLAGLELESPAYVYRPLDYAWEVHGEWIERYGGAPKKVLLLGMNPGPFGMAQTGIPFGSVAMVRDWLDLAPRPIEQPPCQHPKKPVLGFDCPREEVSGARLWGWARDRFESPQRFLADFWVSNYCPLLFLDEGGRNLTPDKLRASERAALDEPCGRALRDLVVALGFEWAIGVGVYAEARLREACSDLNVHIARILHPSPASPAANRGWARAVDRQLAELGVLQRP